MTSYRTYREYLATPEWRHLRAVVFARAGGTCERCGVARVDDVHHVRYPPWGSFDLPVNLLGLCHRCHADIHGRPT